MAARTFRGIDLLSSSTTFSLQDLEKLEEENTMAFLKTEDEIQKQERLVHTLRRNRLRSKTIREAAAESAPLPFVSESSDPVKDDPTSVSYSSSPGRRDGGLLAQYLDRPDILEKALGLTSSHKKAPIDIKIIDEGPSTTSNHDKELSFEEEPSTPIQTTSTRLLSSISVSPSSIIPATSKAVEDSNNTFKMPVYHLISPRTRRKINLLPAPNKVELAQIDQLEQVAKAQSVRLKTRRGLYHTLHPTHQHKQSETSGDNTEKDTERLFADLQHEIATLMETTKTSCRKGLLLQSPTLNAAVHIRQPSAPLIPGIGERAAALEGTTTPRTNWWEWEVYNEGHHDRSNNRIAKLYRDFGRTKQVQDKEVDIIMGKIREYKRRQEMGRPSNNRRLERMVQHLWKLYTHVAGRPAIQHWQVWSQKITLYRQECAARIMQARMLQKLAKETAKVMKGMTKLQEDRSKARIKQHVVLVGKAALSIQVHWRGYVARQKVQRMKREQAASTLIQINWRIIYDYRKVKLFRLISTKRDKAAIKIQAGWRAYMARVQYRLRLKIKKVAQTQASQQRKELIRLEEFHRTGAAVTIQRFWRHVVGYKEHDSLLRIIQQSKAIVIQKRYRHYRARKYIRSLRKGYRQERRRQHEAAIQIQCQIRKFLARCRYDAIKYSQEKHALVRRMEKETVFAARFARIGGPYSCITIDTWKQKELLQRVVNFFDPRYEALACQKAIHIQRIYRGHRARRRVKNLRERDRFKTYNDLLKRKMKAFLDLQRVYRGRCGRRIARHARQTVVVTLLQRLWRGHAVRTLYHHLRLQHQAAVILQKYTRGRLAWKHHRPGVLQHRVRTRKVKIMQRFARRWLARMHRRSQLEFERRLYESRTAAQFYIDLRLRMIGHQLLLTSLEGNLEYKATYGRRQQSNKVLKQPSISDNRSKKQQQQHSSPARREFPGEVQAMFSHFAQTKGENKLENTGLVQLLRSSPGILGPHFNETDCDLLFSKLKVPNTKHITWQSFLTALETISASIYTDLKRYYYKRGRDARRLSLICENFFAGAWAEPYRQQLNEHVHYYVDMLWARVQAFIRGWLGRIYHQRRLADLIHKRRYQKQNRAAIVIQCCYRRALAREQVVALAREVYVKYIDPTTQLPYWYQSRTKKTSWIKPKIFGLYDVQRAKRLPDKATEFVVMCVNCDAALAQTACEACEEVFCRECSESVHMKGHKREHVGKAIPMCPECTYQMATKLCKSCTFQAGKSVHYCDVCFWNIHDNKLKGGRFPQHKIEDIVMNCVECERLAARWRCVDCRDLYCTGCFSKVHARGKKVHHKYEALRYYTRGMHLAYELQLVLEARKQDMAKHMLIVQEIYVKRKQDAAVKIQKTWRGVLGRRSGRKYLRCERRKLRVAYRLRKADDFLRHQRFYQVLDYLGLAPALRSDTMEEKVLKHFPTLVRKMVTARVVDNIEFTPNQGMDRKKVPKRGFNAGTEKELIDQGFYGGIRLPGVFTLKEGERMIHTSVDLREFLNQKSRIRIKHLHFSIDSRKGIEEGRIYINRLWRHDSVENIVMYKMSDLHVIEQFVYDQWWEFVSSKSMQTVIGKAVLMEEQMSKFYEAAVAWAKKEGLMWLAEAFKRGIEWHVKRARRTKHLLREYQGRYTLDGRDGPTPAEEDATEALANLEAKEDAKNRSFENKYMKEEESEWTDEGRDARSGKRRWRNRKTGEVDFENPLMKKSANSDALTFAQKKMLEDKKKRDMKKKIDAKVRKVL